MLIAQVHVVLSEQNTNLSILLLILGLSCPLSASAPIFSPFLAPTSLCSNEHLFLFIIKILIEFDSDKHAMYALMSYSVLTLRTCIYCILCYQYSNKLPIKPCYKKIDFSLKSTGLVYYCRNHIREDIIAILAQHKPDST